MSKINIMDNSKAKELTGSIFDSISTAKSIAELGEIEKRADLAKFKMNTDKYSKINFQLVASDIQRLVGRGILTNGDYSIQTDTFSKEADPIAKLLYALAWKNGDLGKLKHIINGIVDAENPENVQEDALVFYQFGKYLTKTTGEPIIDQHVIRAFAVHHSNSDAGIEKWRRLGTLSAKQKGHMYQILEYKKWMKSTLINLPHEDKEESAYYIDRILFATGKAIKIKKEKANLVEQDGSANRI